MPSPNSTFTWQEIATTLLSPTPSTIALTILCALGLPFLFHLYLYHTAPKQTTSNLPTILLAGPSGSGKTTLQTLLATGAASETHTSQTPATALCQLPQSKRSAADRYRSENDTSANERPKFLLLDTPGHGKLRHHALELLQPNPAAAKKSAQPNLRALLYTVDSASLATASGLTAAAEYLHDLLLLLQKRTTQHKGSRPPDPIPVLIAGNKQDVFTALPTSLVQTRLEEEVGRVRASRAKGVQGVGGAGEGEGKGAFGGEEEEAEWLGEFGGDGEFGFEELANSGVEVTVVGGSCREGEGVEGWWEWVGGVL